MRRAHSSRTTAIVMTKQDDRLAALFAADTDPLRRLVLNASPPPPAGLAGAAAQPAARILREGANWLVAQANTGQDGGYLLLLDSYDPGWRVTVDGSPAPLLQANELFRAVRLAPGQHEVEFRYRPDAVPGRARHHRNRSRRRAGAPDRTGWRSPLFRERQRYPPVPGAGRTRGLTGARTGRTR